MRELVIISGKGGTGKTSLTAAFASLAQKSILCDADVDAADLHLLLQPAVQEHYDFMGGKKPILDAARCTECGKCREVCRFSAINAQYVFDAIRCEGCGVCAHFCPEAALVMQQQRSGEWYVSQTRFGQMVHARLGIAEENSGKLVSLIRKKTRELAEQHNYDLILTDGPPGIGCPVIAAIGGATALLIVVEPTVSGLHDMERVIDLAAHFKVPGMLCVNKFDLNPAMTEQIESLAKTRNITVLGRIPFDPVFTLSMVAGKTIFEYGTAGQTQHLVQTIWNTLINTVSMNSFGIVDFTKTIR